MRNTFLVSSLIILVLGSLAFSSSANSQPAGIIVQNADNVFESNIGLDAGLATNIESIAPHCIIESADGVACFDLSKPPGNLQSLLNLIPLKLIVASADGSLPTELRYPVGLIGDTLPPQISQVEISQPGEYAMWETDEFSISEIRFGTQMGVYTQTVSDSYFVKTHLLTLNGLTSGVTYYYQIRSIDRSGNIGEYYFPGFSVSGNVIDASGEPISDVTIFTSVTQVAATNNNGDYILGGLTPGVHTITPYHRFYTFAPLSIDVSEGNNVTDINFTGTLNIHYVYLPLVIVSK